MKFKYLYLIIIIISLFSCSSIDSITDEITNLLGEKLTIEDLLTAKQKIDDSKNPAEVLLLKNSLTEKILILTDITVKDVINSTNVDYDFCILADIQTNKGAVECYIYTKSINKISKLKKGESIITVEGKFKRYFSMLDNYYTKIEITNSNIKLKKI